MLNLLSEVSFPELIPVLWITTKTLNCLLHIMFLFVLLPGILFEFLNAFTLIDMVTSFTTIQFIGPIATGIDPITNVPSVNATSICTSECIVLTSGTLFRILRLVTSVSTVVISITCEIGCYTYSIMASPKIILTFGIFLLQKCTSHWYI